MKDKVFNKFNKFLFYPDLSNKFLIPTVQHIVSPKKFDIYLKYIFSSRKIYDYIALKALMMISSIYPRRCLLSSRLIILKFGRTQCYSIIYLKMTLQEIAPVLSYYLKAPAKIATVMGAHIRESKHFAFPGFVNHLKLPSWKRNVNISFYQNYNKDQYFLFFYKTAYLD